MNGGVEGKRTVKICVRRNLVSPTVSWIKAPVALTERNSRLPFAETVMQMDLRKRLTKEFYIPDIMIDVDHADVRRYSEVNMFLRVEALIESIVQNHKIAV